LTRRGVAVLRYDDRGVGGSTAKPDAVTLDVLAADVTAAVTFLAGQPEIDGDRVGLIGHSEGGIIAPMVAAKERGVAFIVALAPPGVPGQALLPMQLGALLRAGGVSDDAAAQA